MGSMVAVMRFRMEACERCRRETIQAVRDPSASLGAGQQRICSACEPAAFERAAVEAGRSEFLR